MKLISFIPFYVIIGLNIVYAQVPSNSLFLIANKESDSIKISNRPENTKIDLRVTGGGEKGEWKINMNHYNIENGHRNLFRYLLPKEMVQNFIRKRNAIPLKKFIQQIHPLDITSIHKQIRLRSYYYEYLDGNVYKTDLRQNIFLIFESDLNNKFVECYELDVLSYSNEPID
ncbi:hypothetical protein [Aquimarina algiphila]|uniref:hypothetical protein n=1 Tax=Aquimarina algiphila TaxID=2047982 RepID=UPI00232FD3BC|nr:hypothetical protein [Aquimarina algiphila]